MCHYSVSVGLCELGACGLTLKQRLLCFYVVMESCSGIGFQAIPGGPEATRAMEADETRTQVPLAESMLDQAAEADRVEPGD